MRVGSWAAKCERLKLGSPPSVGVRDWTRIGRKGTGVCLLLAGMSACIGPCRDDILQCAACSSTSGFLSLAGEAETVCRSAVLHFEIPSRLIIPMQHFALRALRTCLFWQLFCGVQSLFVCYACRLPTESGAGGACRCDTFRIAMLPAMLANPSLVTGHIVNLVGTEE